MNFVIPMAGEGRRFIQAGYTRPKFLLEAHGKSLLEWSVDSLPLELATRLIFIGLKAHAAAHDLEGLIRHLYPRPAPQFLWIDRTTRGQAETVLLAEGMMDPALPLVIFNIDTTFHSPTLAAALQRPGCDGVLGAFTSSEARFSYAAVDAAENVVRVVEKQVISSHALTGLYHFSGTADFLRAARAAIANDERSAGEFYVAPLYDKLIMEGRRFHLDICARHHILGTPEEYEAFRREALPVS